MTLIAAVSFFMLSYSSAGHAIQVSLAWDPLATGTPDGYLAFYRLEGQSYDYSQPVWQGSASAWTISNFQDMIIKFVVTAYNASSESGDSNEVTCSPTVAVLVSNLVAASGAGYLVVPDGLVLGTKVYRDRTITYSSVPAALTGATYVETGNADKLRTGTSFVSFDLSNPATVYVAHDDRITSKPSWLSAFQNEGTKLVTTDAMFSVYSKKFAAGHVTLGG
jgi:hypothetical protein